MQDKTNETDYLGAFGGVPKDAPTRGVAAAEAREAAEAPTDAKAPKAAKESTTK